MVARPEFTVGIEEEYMLVDVETRDLSRDPPESMITETADRVGFQVGHEFLRSQIEIGTRVCTNLQDVRHDLALSRRTVAEVGRPHGIAPIAASTHPFAKWDEQLHTDKERYNLLARDLQVTARRLLISGMHVHVGISDDDLRIDLMNQTSYFLPHLLALTTSSPFWHGVNTGLMSYRMNVWASLPRTGLPEQFSSYGEYERHVDMLVGAGIIEDASKLWWDIRPSVRYPTLELRIADICTRMDDGLAVAALYMCIIHMLWRRRTENQRWRNYANMLVAENVWRAQRYGINGSLVDFGKGELVPYTELVAELCELLEPDAEELGCQQELARCRDIVRRGTSADRQVSVYEKALAQGAGDQDALNAVVDMLIEDTLDGV